MLNDLINIRKRLNLISYSPTEIIGTINPNSQELQNLQNLVNSNCLDEFVIENGKNIPISQISTGTEITIKVYPTNLRPQKYYENEFDLINSIGQKYPPVLFYVYNLHFLSSDLIRPDFIKNYEATTKLISFLVEISDYQKDYSSYKELVFFQSKQLVITTEYRADDLGEIREVENLISHINNSVDKEERRIIFTNELIAYLNKIPEIKNRFKYLIKNFDEIFSIYKKSHNLYLEKYSYQKYKSEIDKEIIEYSKKIQSVINDVQTKLIAIPAALLLVAGQFDLTGEKLYFNIILVFSSFVFAFLLEILIRNQFSALDFVSKDVNKFKNNIEEKKAKILGKDFDETLKGIVELYRKQRYYLNAIRILIWLTPIITFGLFIYSLNNLISIFISIIFNLVYSFV